MVFLRLLLLSGIIIYIAAMTLVFYPDTKDKLKKIENKSPATINHCLPNYIIPEYYKIHIFPYVTIKNDYKESYEKKLLIRGKSIMYINVTIPTKNITLHPLRAKVNLLSLKFWEKFPEKREISEENYTFFRGYTNIILYFSNKLKPGIYILKTTFAGYISDGSGFFRIFNKNDTGSGSLIVGDMQTIKNRYILPCPYEIGWNRMGPSKRTLTVGLISLKGYTVKSNVPKLDLSYQKMYGFIQTNINKIPVMVTHIVAFISSDFDIISNLDKSVNMIYKRRLHRSLLKHAWNITEEVTTHLNSQLHADKLNETSIVNHIVLPNHLKRDVTFPGIVFHREADVLYKKALDNPIHEMEIIRSITRNVVYGLLGNMPFWLKDGIAILLLSRMFTKENMLPFFTIQHQHESLYLNTNTVREYFLNYSRINFLSSYPGSFKSPFILRMLQHIITNNKFEQVIRSYLNNALNSTSDYFWTIMENAVSKSFSVNYNLTERLNRWTQLETYPVLRILRVTDDFTSLEIEYDDAQKIGNWWVPVTYTIGSHLDFNKISLDKNRAIIWINYITQNPISNIRVIPFQDNTLMIANLQQTFPYRVCYDKKNWQAITSYLNSVKFKNIHIINRAQIIDDAFYLALEDYMDFDIFWNVTTYLKQETEYVPWYPMFKVLEYMSSIFPLSDKRVNNIKHDVSMILHSILSIIHYQEVVYEALSTKCLRQEAVKWACILNLSSCKSIANFHLLKHVESGTKRHELFPWWREWTYCNGLRLAEYEIWLKVKDTWISKGDDKILEFLACSQNSSIIMEYLEDLKLRKIKSDNATVRIFHSIIAKHARNDKYLDVILRSFLDIKPRQVSTIAAVIDIINHIYSKEQLEKVRGLAKYVKERYSKFVTKKIEKRLSEIESQMDYLGILSS